MNKLLSAFLKKILTRYTIIQHNSLVKISSKKTDCNDEIKVAIQFHIFFIDLLDEIHNYLKNLQHPFDLYVSTDTREKQQIIQDFFMTNKINSCKQIIVQVVQNKGRDIYPFFYQISPVYKQYDIIGHFHTKKSTTSKIGDRWRKYLYENLLGINYSDNLIKYLNRNKQIGFIAPPPYYEIIKNYRENLLKEKNQNGVLELQEALKIPKSQLSINTIYPAGNMFFARTAAIKQLFDANFNSNSFPPEEGQVENTLQHIIEFIWQYVVEANGFEYKECLRK